MTPKLAALLLLILPLTGCTVIAVADTVGAVAVKTVGAVAGATVDVASAGAGWVFGSDDKEDDD